MRPRGKPARITVRVKVIGIGIALLAGVIFTLPFLIDANRHRPALESELKRILGRDVAIGNLHISLFYGTLAADNISIADDVAFSASPFITSRSLRIGVNLRSLVFSRSVHITGILLEDPEITLIHAPSGDWNFSSLTPRTASGTADATGRNARGLPDAGGYIGQLRITGGRIALVSGADPVRSLRFADVAVTASDLSFDGIFPFLLTATFPGAGALRIEGMAGPVDRRDASLTPFEAAIAVDQFDWIASGFVGKDAGPAGLTALEAELHSDGSRVLIRGHAGTDRLRLVKTGLPGGRKVTLTYTCHHDLATRTGVLDEAQVEAGKAAARLTGTYDARGEAVLLTLKLHGAGMPVPDLAALLPPLGIVLPEGSSLQGGTAHADLVSVGTFENLVTSGTVGLDDVRLAGFDLGWKIAAVASLAGIRESQVTRVESLVADLRITPDEIQVSRLSMRVPSMGEMAGYGVIGAGHALDFMMLARVNTSASLANRLGRIVGMPAENSLNIPLRVGGTTADPRFSLDLKGTAGKLLDAIGRGKGPGTQGKLLQ